MKNLLFRLSIVVSLLGTCVDMEVAFGERNEVSRILVMGGGGAFAWPTDGGCPQPPNAAAREDTRPPWGKRRLAASEGNNKSIVIH